MESVLWDIAQQTFCPLICGEGKSEADEWKKPSDFFINMGAAPPPKNKWDDSKKRIIIYLFF
jgi:hypothetical protein